MKTQEELNQLKKEYESLASKLNGLSEEEIEQITGGTNFNIPKQNDPNYEHSFYKNEVFDNKSDFNNNK